MTLRAESGGKSRFDWGFIATVAGLVLMGTLAVFSAANPLPYWGQIIQRHILALVLGAALFIFAMNFNYQVFQDQAKAIYGLALALLVCVIVLGTAHKGHKAWLNLGIISFQPSELARTAMILVLAAFLSRRARRIIRQNLAVSLGVVVVMVVAAGLGIVPLTVGVFAHEGSTVVVCMNSLRLLLGRNA